VLGFPQADSLETCDAAQIHDFPYDAPPVRIGAATMRRSSSASPPDDDGTAAVGSALKLVTRAVD
jgi:hypothetical protein